MERSGDNKNIDPENIYLELQKASATNDRNFDNLVIGENEWIEQNDQHYTESVEETRECELQNDIKRNEWLIEEANQEQKYRERLEQREIERRNREDRKEEAKVQKELIKQLKIWDKEDQRREQSREYSKNVEDNKTQIQEENRQIATQEFLRQEQNSDRLLLLEKVSNYLSRHPEEDKGFDLLKLKNNPAEIQEETLSKLIDIVIKHAEEIEQQGEKNEPSKSVNLVLSGKRIHNTKPKRTIQSSSSSDEKSRSKDTNDIRIPKKRERRFSLPSNISTDENLSEINYHLTSESDTNDIYPTNELVAISKEISFTAETSISDKRQKLASKEILQRKHELSEQKLQEKFESTKRQFERKINNLILQKDFTNSQRIQCEQEYKKLKREPKPELHDLKGLEERLEREVKLKEQLDKTQETLNKIIDEIKHEKENFRRFEKKTENIKRSRKQKLKQKLKSNKSRKGAVTQLVKKLTTELINESVASPPEQSQQSITNIQSAIENTPFTQIVEIQVPQPEREQDTNRLALQIHQEELVRQKQQLQQTTESRIQQLEREYQEKLQQQESQLQVSKAQENSANVQLEHITNQLKILQQTNYEKELILEQQKKDIQTLQKEKEKSHSEIHFQKVLSESDTQKLQQINYHQTKELEQQLGEIQELREYQRNSKVQLFQQNHEIETLQNQIKKTEEKYESQSLQKDTHQQTLNQQVHQQKLELKSQRDDFEKQLHDINILHNHLIQQSHQNNAKKDQYIEQLELQVQNLLLKQRDTSLELNQLEQQERSLKQQEKLLKQQKIDVDRQQQAVQRKEKALLFKESQHQKIEENISISFQPTQKFQRSSEGESTEDMLSNKDELAEDVFKPSVWDNWKGREHLSQGKMMRPADIHALPFFGKDTKDDINEFFKNIEAHFYCQGIHDLERTKIIPLKLLNRAKTFFHSLPDKVKRSYPDLKAALVRNFDTAVLQYDRESEFF